MNVHKKLKLFSKRLAILTPILFLAVSLSSGVAHATPSVYAADGVLGQSSYTSVGSGTAANQLNYPSSTVIDTAHHRLFVADLSNDRILVYQLDNNDQIESQSASYALGASNPNSTGNNTANQNSFYESPYAMAYDPVNNRLFVEDYYRVLVFNLSNGISNDMNASYVLGQSNFANTNEATSINTLNGPGPYGGGLAFDPTNDRLFVGDAYRIMVFNVSPATLQTNGNGENASYVLGQANFTSSTYNATQNNLYAPTGIGYDPSNNTLFVADYYGIRVMLFNVSPSTISNYENAYAVLGEPDFTTLNTGASQTALNYAYYGAGGFAIDPTDNQLFLPDQYNNRVLTYNFITMTNNSQLNSGTVGQSYSQTLASTSTQGTVTYDVTSGSLPPGLSLNSSTGVISGSPTTNGTYNFEITAYDTGSYGSFEDDPSYSIVITGGVATSTVSSNTTTSPTAPDTGYGKPANYTAMYALFTVSFVSIIIGNATLLIKKKH